MVLYYLLTLISVNTDITVPNRPVPIPKYLQNLSLGVTSGVRGSTKPYHSALDNKPENYKSPRSNISNYFMSNSVFFTNYCNSVWCGISPHPSGFCNSPQSELFCHQVHPALCYLLPLQDLF